MQSAPREVGDLPRSGGGGGGGGGRPLPQSAVLAVRVLLVAPHAHDATGNTTTSRRIAALTIGKAASPQVRVLLYLCALGNWVVYWRCIARGIALEYSSGVLRPRAATRMGTRRGAKWQPDI